MTAPTLTDLGTSYGPTVVDGTPERTMTPEQPFDRAAIRARQAEYVLGTAWSYQAHKDIDALLGEVERLERALRNIRMSAARGLVFGSQATPQTPERMIERKEAALKTVLDLCASVGVCGSVLRSEEGGA